MGDLGYTYNGLSGKTKQDFDTGEAFYIPFLNVLENTEIDINNLGRVKVSSLEKQVCVQKSDLFFNTSSETPEEVGMCAYLSQELNNTFLNSFCFGFRLYDKCAVDPRFLTYLFNSVYGRRVISSLAQGVTRYNLSKERLLRSEIHLPPITEQHRIANCINIVEENIVETNTLISKYEAIKKATVNLFLSSKPDVRHVKLTEVAFLSTETIKTCVIDKEWYIGTENMLANCGGVEKNNAPIQYPRVRSYCQGDILISNIRPYLKKIWLADRNGGCSTDVNVIRCKSNDLQFDYLYFVLSQDRFFEYVMSNAVGTKMPRGDKAVIGDFEFPLPTIEEQTRVVHALKEQDAMISNAKCQLVKLEHLKQGMMTYFFG